MTGKTDRKSILVQAAGLLLPAFITLMVFMGVIAVKGIFPFGSNTVDYYDMLQTNAPLYYHIWDFLHGKSGLFYTWYLDEGQNLSMAGAIQWNISVFNLFFYLIPRRYCFEALSLFMGLRLFFMSFNMSLFLKKTVKAPFYIRTGMSTAYGLCGYTLTHYTIPTYLDTAALLPVLMLSVYYLLKGTFKPSGHEGNSTGYDEKDLKKPRGCMIFYALCVGYMTALSYYLGFMNLLFILLVSGTYLLLLCLKEERREVALRLVTATVAGVLISAFMLVPAALQMSESSRFNSNLRGSFAENIKSILLSVGADMYYIKWFILSGSLAAIVITAVGIIRFRKEGRKNIFVILFCFFPCALIPFESINILWHLGTYYHYPIRCGYLIPFVLLTAGAYYAGKLYPENEGKEKIKPLKLLPGCVIAAAVAAAALIIYNRQVWEIHKLFNAWLIFGAVITVLYLIFALAKKPSYIMALLSAELICGAYAGYGCPNFTDVFSSEPEQSGQYVREALSLSEAMNIKESRTDRIKNPDTSLNTNYGMVIRRATAGGWANTAKREQIDSAMSLGYNAHFMRIMDSGGTIFSDAMMHITQVLTCVPGLYEEAEGISGYEKKAQHDGYVLYDTKYVLPFAMRTGADFDGAHGDIFNIAGTTNSYYEALAKASGVDTGEKLMTIYKDKEFVISSKTALYLQGGESGRIEVNGKTIPVPTMGDTGNTAYPASFNSNLLFLGIYESGDIRIDGADGAAVMGLDIKKLEELCDRTEREEGLKAENNRISFNIKAGKNEQAMLPLSYDRGFTAYVNGRKRDIVNIDNLFMGVPLDEGDNEVVIRFMPSGLKAGAAASVTGLLFILLMLKIPTGDAFKRICLYLTDTVYGLAVVILYVVPIAVFIIHQVVKRI